MPHSKPTTGDSTYVVSRVNGVKLIQRSLLQRDELLGTALLQDLHTEGQLPESVERPLKFEGMVLTRPQIGQVQLPAQIEV